jgi:hypothetical protein
MRIRIAGVALATAALALTACGGGNSANTAAPDTQTSSGAPSTTPATPEPSPAQGAPLATFGDGNYLVPKDVAVGTYHSAGAAKDGVDCYWQRDGADGTPTANHASKDPVTVTITATDTAFHVTGCKPFSKVS